MMTKKMQTMMCAALALVLTIPAAAQERDGQQPAGAPPAVQRPPSGQPELSTPREPAGSNNTNVKIELTITDQRPEGPPVVKTVTATVADRSMARIRTSGSVRTPMGGRDVVLNVDAGPNLVTVNGVTKLRLVLTIEYRPVAAESDTERTSTPSINEQLTVILEDGKPLMVSQSADPSTDRKVKVEVKATIMR
jgi:glucose/arabinose dehydrogenase